MTDFGLRETLAFACTVSLANERTAKSAGRLIPSKPEYPTCNISRRVIPIVCGWFEPGDLNVLLRRERRVKV